MLEEGTNSEEKDLPEGVVSASVIAQCTLLNKFNSVFSFPLMFIHFHVFSYQSITSFPFHFYSHFPCTPRLDLNHSIHFHMLNFSNALFQTRLKSTNASFFNQSHVLPVLLYTINSMHRARIRILSREAPPSRNCEFRGFRQLCGEDLVRLEQLLVPPCCSLAQGLHPC